MNKKTINNRITLLEETIIALKIFAEAIERYKKLFPNTHRIYFYQPFITSVYHYNISDKDIYADLFIGINIKEEKFIITAGDWHSDFGEFDISILSNKKLIKYSKRLALMTDKDISEKNIWSEKACLEYSTKTVKSGDY